MRHVVHTLPLALVLLSVPCLAPAGVIVDQSALNAGSVTSQSFTDFPEFSGSAFDDFTLGSTYALTTLTIFGVDEGDPSFNTAVTASIYAAPDLTTAPILTALGSQVGGNLEFDFGGALLGPGSYWLASYVTRPFSGGGQWFWTFGFPVSGSQAMFQNPGGGFGLGTGTVPVATLLGTDPVDMAFVLSGDLVVNSVPEPSTFALAGLAGLGGLVAAIRRRKTAAA